MRIRRAHPADAGEILTVQRAAFVAEAQRYGDALIPPLTEGLEAVAAAVEDDGVHVVVAVLDRQATGERVVGSARVRVEDGVGHVGRIVVAPDQQGQGVGGSLLRAVEQAVESQVEAFELFTGADSLENLGWYGRHGYVLVGNRHDGRGVPLAVLRRQTSGRGQTPTVPTSSPTP